MIKGAKHIRRILGRRGALYIASGTTAALFLALSEFAMAFMIQAMLQHSGALQRVSPRWFGVEPPQTLSAVLFWLVGVGFLRGALYSATLSAPPSVEHLAVARLRRLALHRYLPAGSKFGPTELSRAIGDLSPRAGRYLGAVASSIPLFGLILALVVALVYLDPLLGALTVFGLAVIGAVYRFASRRAQSMMSKTRIPTTLLFATIDRIIRVIEQVRIYRLEQREAAEFSGVSGAVMRASTGATILQVSVTTMMAVLGTVLLAGIVAVDSAAGRALGPGILGFIYLMVRLVQSINSLSSNLAGAGVMREAFAEVVGWLPSDARLAEASMAEGARVKTPTKQANAALVAPSVVVSNLEYEAANELYKGLSFVLVGGTDAIIVGRSGSGKSTLLRIVAGLVQPSRGSILIDGLASDEYFRANSERIGYVGAVDRLFGGTVRENLLYGLADSRPDGEIWDALSAVELRHVVTKLRGGLDFVLGDDAELSAGERQRLGIARALLRRPVLLLLDEATSHLDGETEKRVLNAIAALKGRCTTLVVSHRETVVASASMVISLGSGERRIASGGNQP